MDRYEIKTLDPSPSPFGQGQIRLREVWDTVENKCILTTPNVQEAKDEIRRRSRWDKPMSTTNKASHTPGPWEVEDRDIVIQDGARETVGPFVVFASIDGEMACVAELQDDGEPGVALADARLIAAAPDLLAACETSLRWLAKLAADHDGDEIALRAMKQHDNVRAAIAKAEGNA